MKSPSLFSGDTSVPVKPEPKAEPVKKQEPPDVTVSPWLLIPPPTMMPGEVPQSQNSGKTPDPTGGMGPALLRKPVMGGSSDLYLPFSFTPGYTPAAPGSAVIYSQPDAKQ